MTAERTLIEVAARALCVRRRNDPDFGYPGKPNWTLYVDDALAMLRALRDHGPTPAMVEAGARAIEETELRDVWEGDPKGFYWAWMDCSSAAFKASLAAELEERH